MANRPDPYVKKDPGDIMLAADWNEMQVQGREEIRAHRHSGEADGQPIAREGIAQKAIDGSRIDPASDVTVRTLTADGNLTVKGELKVNGKAILDNVADLLATIGPGLAGGYIQNGTTAQTANLNISGNGTFGGTVMAGSVGIGAARARPFSKLDVVGEDGTFIFPLRVSKGGKFTDSGGHTSLIGLGVESSGWSKSAIGHTRTSSYDVGYLGFYVNSENTQGTNVSASDLRMVINNNGNVGIGTTNPQGKLSVMQVVAGLSTGLQISSHHTPNVVAGAIINAFDDGGVTVRGLSLQTNGGNVGIGTNAPAKQLDVNGDIQMAAAKAFSSPGRMHITGEELLYLLHKKGVIIGKEWGGTGDLTVQGAFTAAGGEQLEVIAVGGRGDWAASNHPIKQYFHRKLNGKPRGTFLRALSDHPDWQGHYWNGWVDNNLKVRVAHSYYNTKATTDNASGVQ